MTPKQFLLYGGIILVVLGVLGMVGLGPTSDASVLNGFFWLDQTENMLHLLFGVVALGAYFLLKDEKLIKWLVALVGVIALIATIVGFLNAGDPAPNAGITNLENPADNILHLVVAIWAFMAAFMGGKGSSQVQINQPSS